jgi:DNA repair protein SbcD/Mre11
LQSNHLKYKHSIQSHGSAGCKEIMFQFIHAADIHLDSPLCGLERYEGAPVEEIRLATRRALENLVLLAVESKVAFVLIAGDLFDGDWKDYNTGLFLARQMSMLKEANIPVYIIKGNHDAASRMTRALKMPENVHIFSHSKPETFHLDSCAASIHGQSFGSAAVERNLAEGYPRAEGGRFNLGLLHTCATGREGHERYAPCSMNDLINRGYDYWALGHVHKREELNSSPPVHFPGNIQGRHIRETGEKGCLLVTVDDRNQASATFEPLGVLRWEHCRVALDSSGSGDDVLAAVSKELRDLFKKCNSSPLAVRIELAGACRADSLLRARPEHWINQIRMIATDSASGELWVEKIKINTRTAGRESDVRASAGPVAELEALIAEYRNDPEQLKLLREELSDLDRKLSVEVKDLIGWNDEAFLSDALLDVQNILLSRLAHKE